MKKLSSLILILLFITGNLFAQKTNDGGSSGGNNDGNTPKNTDKNTNPDTGDNTCMNTALSITGILFGAYQSNLISSSKTNPSVTSFEILLHGGTATSTTDSYITVLPRVRLNYGALSGDVRYSYYTNENGSTSFLDALADFNIIAGKGFKMSIGQGIMYILDDTNQTYHESYIGMDLGFKDRKILISPEFRLAYDWSIKKPANSELSVRGGYKILSKSKFAAYANIGAAYQYMYDSDSKTIMFGGLDIFIQ
ncbi:MAG: hypothetical protein L3J35_10280 [Bacteroidales bacterium]|nr:hypothetical protein [Bacteroidales bacterium]